MKDSLAKSSAKNKKHFDRKARMRELKAGDLVLILLPTAESKLLMQWRGPFRVLERIGLSDYRIQISDTVKIYHINMLKRYYEIYEATSRHGDGGSKTLESDDGSSRAEEVVAVLMDDEEDNNLSLPVSYSPSEAGETVADVHICKDLGAEE